MIGDYDLRTGGSVAMYSLHYLIVATKEAQTVRCKLHRGNVSLMKCKSNRTMLSRLTYKDGVVYPSIAPHMSEFLLLSW